MGLFRRLDRKAGEPNTEENSSAVGMEPPVEGTVQETVSSAGDGSTTESMEKTEEDSDLSGEGIEGDTKADNPENSGTDDIPAFGGSDTLVTGEAQPPVDPEGEDEDADDDSVDDGEEVLEEASGRMLTFRPKKEPQEGEAVMKPRLEFTGMYIVADSMRIIGEIQIPSDVVPGMGQRQDTVIQGDAVTPKKASGLISRQDVLGLLNGSSQEEIIGEMPEYISRIWLDGQVRMLAGWKVPETCSPGEPGACRNEVELSGKIIAKRWREDGGMAFMLACGFKGMKRDREGRPIKDIITLAFSKQQMKQYGDFSIGDRVMAGGILQNVIDRKHPFTKEGDKTVYYPVSTVCMGLWMTHGERKNVGRYDYNAARISGPVIEAAAIIGPDKKPNGWVSVRIRTTVRRVTPGHNDASFEKTREYTNKTYVRVYVGEEDAQRVAANTLTPGTWVDVSGHIFGRIKQTEEAAKAAASAEERR